MSVYLDNAATTAVSPAAAAAAQQAMLEGFGNPSSLYPVGRAAAAALADHRAAVSAALGCAPQELVFTSCGSESDNWAILMGAQLNRRRGKHLITTAVEHAAVLESCKALAAQGWEITYLKPDRSGNLSLTELEAALRPDTALVSMMLVNNELGTVYPVKEAAALVHRYSKDILFHCDAVQGFLKLPFTPAGLGVDLLSISGHKVHAPKGIGALYLRKGLKLPPLILGGGQENGLRSGTEPTAQIAAFAAACREGLSSREADIAHMQALKQYALESLLPAVPGLKRLGDGQAPHILCFSLVGYKSEVLVRVLGDAGICVSAGSACHRGKPSHVFAALGLSKEEREGAFRVSFCAGSTRADVDALKAALVDAQKTLFPSLS